MTLYDSTQESVSPFRPADQAVVDVVGVSARAVIGEIAAIVVTGIYSPDGGLDCGVLVEAVVGVAERPTPSLNRSYFEIRAYQPCVG